MITEGISKAVADLRDAGCDADADRIESALTKAEAVPIREFSAWVGDMKTSAGMDYYVCVGHGKDCGEHMTPNVYKIRGRAEYDVACWNHLFGLCEAPDILAFDTDEPTATPQPPKPAGAVPLPEPDGVMVLDMYSGSVGSRAVSTPHWHRSTVITYGDARAQSMFKMMLAGRADAVSMAQRFLRWRLPVTFAPDAGISFDRSYCEKWATWPTGTNLFTADEAADMMRFVLETSPAGAPPAQQPLDDSANNAGVATGSRNESPSESVTRGSPQVTTSPASAPQTMATQGEAVYLVQHKDTTVKSNWTELTKDSYEGGCFPDELFRRRELYTGSQP